jgi:hypothetical protein
VQPEREIETALVKFEIEAKQKRKATARNILIIIGLAVFFFIIDIYFNQQFSFSRFVYFITVFLGGAYIIFSEIPRLIQPLEPEHYAVKNIADAIRVLEKSKEDIACEEAYRKVKTAYRTLKGMSLTDSIAWYKKTNETFRKFLKNLKLIVLPAIKDSSIDSVMKVEHLKHVALAIYSLNASKLDAINRMLETESSYKKSIVKLGDGFGHRVFESLRTEIHISRDVAFVFSLFVGCAVFYYMVVNYLSVPNGYALTASVAAFVGLLAIYVRGKPAQRWSPA